MNSNPDSGQILGACGVVQYRPFACPVCGTRFTRRSGETRHLRAYHPDRYLARLKNLRRVARTKLR